MGEKTKNTGNTLAKLSRYTSAGEYPLISQAENGFWGTLPRNQELFMGPQRQHMCHSHSAEPSWLFMLNFLSQPAPFSEFKQ